MSGSFHANKRSLLELSVFLSFPNSIFTPAIVFVKAKFLNTFSPSSSNNVATCLRFAISIPNVHNFNKGIM